MKATLIEWLSVFVMLTAVTGCSHLQSHRIQKSEVDAVRNAYLTAVNSGNANAAADLYSNTAVRMPPEQKPVVGLEAIRRSYISVSSQTTISEVFDPQEVQIDQEFAVERGIARYTVTEKESGKSEGGESSYVWVYKRQADGELKIHYTIWNSDSSSPGNGR